MTESRQLRPLYEYPTMDAARNAANEMAMNSTTIALAGTLYQQGGRRFVSIVLPLQKLFDLTIPPHDRPKRGEPKPDPATTRNRPLDTTHVRDITRYLRDNPTYLIPPVIVNSSEPLHIFVGESPVPTKPCVIVLPDALALYVTDGQHRIEAMRQAHKEKPELSQDAVGVTLIEEMDLQRIHQDFWDAAQTKRLEPALLVEYDGRSPGNSLARAISTTVPLFRERTERLSNQIGKNSVMLYSTNHIKQACFHLILGEVKGKNVLDRVNERIAPAYDAWVTRIQAFFERMSAYNPQWRSLVDKPMASGQIVDPVPTLRTTYLHCVAGGLNVMCAVGHKIVSLQATASEDFSPEQEHLLERLATLDWARTNPMWHGGIVSTSGSVTPHRGNLALAIAKVKEHIGMDLTDTEQKAIDRSMGLVEVGAETETEEV